MIQRNCYTGSFFWYYLVKSYNYSTELIMKMPNSEISFWRLSNPKLILYWGLGKISFKMYFANSTSFLRIVILLACEANMLVISNSFTKRASLPSCRASIAALWNLISVLYFMAVLLTSRWKGSPFISRSVVSWCFLISRSAFIHWLDLFGSTLVLVGWCFGACYCDCIWFC